MDVLEMIIPSTVLAIVASYLEDETLLCTLSDKTLILAAGFGKRGFDRYDSLFFLCYLREEIPDDIIDLAIKKGRKRIIEYLLNSGVPLLPSHLPLAFEKGDSEIVFFLLSQGLSVNNRCLESACLSGNISLVKLLLNFFSLKPTFRCFLLCCRGDHPEVLKLLPKRDDMNYFSLCREASMYGSLKAVKYLLEDLECPYEQDVLKYACKYGRTEIVEYFLYHRHFNDKEIWAYSSREAIRKGSINVLYLILSKIRLDLNELLIYTCTIGKVAIVNYLLDKGADDKEMGLEAACAADHRDIVKLYIQRGEEVPVLTRRHFCL